jgi:hypothetical protein
MSVDIIGWHRHWSAERFFGEKDVFGPMPECAAQEAYSFWFKGGGYWPLVLRTPTIVRVYLLAVKVYSERLSVPPL